MMSLDADALARCMRSALEVRDVNPISVEHVVRSLIQTSLRGVDSHGINLFPHYCRAVDGGRINREPRIEIQRSSSGVSVIDADHAFGHHAGALAVDHAGELAREAGIAAVAVKRSTHFGAAAYFSLRAAMEDRIGFAFCNADALVKAHNGVTSFFGTNPICFCAPMADEEPICLDMATSFAAWNKVVNARKNNSKIPLTWGFDGEGRAVSDPNLVRSLAPLGGYKGFGLGMMVDVLCALLADGPMSKDLLPMFDAPLSARREISHFFMVIDISKFVEVQKFKQRLQEMANRIRGIAEMAGADDRIMVAGDPEKRSYSIRTKVGIPIEEERFGEFLGISPDFARALTIDD